MGRGEWSINHIDGDKENNYVENLEWTQKNREHAIEMGLIKTGEDHPNCKVSDADVSKMRLIYSKSDCTYQELADAYGISREHVGAIIRYESRAA